ncbi:hypothetical protein [Xenophilus sp. Marseille-Q4582]|uniref:hypothetical protein n=1 Tax=Xenophilus sp. Marseille-Q4582 TaxID=2866600 RepID=UPI001CE3DED2|nr:hypothetical protein [Xenophilus sp. Marseille-Q4582]
MTDPEEAEALRMALAAVMASHPRPAQALAQLSGLIAEVQVRVELGLDPRDDRLLAALQKIRAEFA